MHSSKMGNASSNEDPWAKTFDKIRNTHDLAYAVIEKAITLEEQEKPQEAIEKYKEGIALIDKALNIQVTCPDNPDFSWERACSMIQKMKKTRAEVLTRINCIQSSPEYVPVEPPPSYEEAVSNSPTPDGMPRTYNELASALNELQIEPTNSKDKKADVIYSYDNVMLYFISPGGEVTSSSEPQTLNIIVVEDTADSEANTYLQVGDWVYPLVPGVSPCFRTDYGAFILPDVHSDVPGSSIGLILPTDADAVVYEILESILHGIVKQSPPGGRAFRKRREAGDAISNKIINGAWHISQGLVKGAQKVESLINYSTPKIINRMTPANEPAAVPPTLSKGIKIAENASSTAANVTGFVADKVGCATMKLGRFLAPHIEKQGTRLLTTGFRYSEEEASTKVKGVLNVAAGAVEGFSTIYRGLETSASILGNSLKNNTVQVVQHKYGQPAGEVADGSFNVAGNVWTVNNNIKGITPKGLAKRTAKDTGKAMVQGFRHQMRHENGYAHGNTNGVTNNLPLEMPSTSKCETVTKK